MPELGPLQEVMAEELVAVPVCVSPHFIRHSPHTKERRCKFTVRWSHPQARKAVLQDKKT